MNLYQKILSKPALKYGLIGGIITIIGVGGLRVMGTEAFADPTTFMVVYGALFIINISLSIAAAVSFKNSNGGILEFKDGVINIFLSLLIIVVFYNVFYHVLFNVIDTDLNKTLSELRIERLEEAKAEGTIKEKQYKREIKIAEETDLTILVTIQQLLIGTAISFLFALITAAFLRKEPEGG